MLCVQQIFPEAGTQVDVELPERAVSVDERMEMFVTAHPTVVPLLSLFVKISQEIPVQFLLVQKTELLVDDRLDPHRANGFRLRHDRGIVFLLGQGFRFGEDIHAQRFVTLHLHGCLNPDRRIKFQI